MVEPSASLAAAAMLYLCGSKAALNCAVGKVRVVMHRLEGCDGGVVGLEMFEDFRPDVVFEGRKDTGQEE